MNQNEIYRNTSAIISYWAAQKPGRPLTREFFIRVDNILKMRGIRPLEHPMYATGRLLVVRDLLRIWYS